MPDLRRPRTALVVAALALLPAAARAEDGPAPIPIGPHSITQCSGAAITPTLTLDGAFPEALSGAYVMFPFEVPAGTTQVRIKYCWESGNTVDLGIWQAREGDAPWAEPQFRGWGGSSHPDVAISAQGFSTEEEYLAAPRGYVPGRTTRGFVPGPIPPGTWAAELGVAYVAPGGDAQVDFRVEIELSSDPAFAAEPYEPAAYDDTPASPNPGWYIGDLHVHAEHSNLGAATMTETFDYAFGPREEQKAGLDFIALTDYVTTSAWDEIGRYQAAHPGKLIIRSGEIITYMGHANQHRSLRYIDHRIGGPVYQLDPEDGALAVLREPRLPAEAFAEIETAGGIAQLNHVTSCPSSSADCRRICRGCPWDYTEQQTDYTRVQAIEVPSGSAFTFAVFGFEATRFWEQRLADGHRIAVVGVSDSHDAGVVDPNDPLSTAIGNASTVVYAEELSEQGILDGIRAGHTYAKVKAAGADLRFSVTGDEGGDGIMGDAIPDRSGTLRGEVLNVPDGEPTPVLRLYRDGVAIADVAVPPTGIVQDWPAETPGIYRLEYSNALGIQALTSSIQVPEPGAGAGAAAAGTAVAALAARRRRRHAASWKMTPSV